MAKSLLSVRRAKKPRVSHSEAYLINRKYMGDEPEYTGSLSDTQYGFALNWYNTMCDKKEAREYTREYLLSKGRKEDAKKLNRVKDIYVSTTAGWICRLYMRGCQLPLSSKDFMETKLREMFRTIVEEEPDDVAPKVSIQDRVRERTQDIIGEIEEMLDNGEEFSLYDWLKAKEIPASYAAPIAAYYARWLTELIEAYEGRDAQLKEAYRYLTKRQLSERIKFMHSIVSDAEKYGSVAKKTKAPRKPRAVSKDKILKHLKYQREDGDFKVASINPEKILGAQELWCFNTKYKVLTVFRAIDRGGLQVKRSSIVGFDDKISMSRGCGRQAQSVVDTIVKGGKMVIRKQMEGLKTVKPLQERINENTILLRVL